MELDETLVLVRDTHEVGHILVLLQDRKGLVLRLEIGQRGRRGISSMKSETGKHSDVMCSTRKLVEPSASEEVHKSMILCLI